MRVTVKPRRGKAASATRWKTEDTAVGMGNTLCRHCGSEIVFVPADRPENCRLCGGVLDRPWRISRARVTPRAE